MKFSYPEGSTPLDDISGLKVKWVKTQDGLMRKSYIHALREADKGSYESLIVYMQKLI